MERHRYPDRQLTVSKQISVAIFFAGALLFLLGLAQVLPKSSQQTRLFKSSQTERDLAIERAKQSGQKQYLYKTNFIPGIGVIADPQRYKADWESQIQQPAE